MSEGCRTVLLARFLSASPICSGSRKKYWNGQVWRRLLEFRGQSVTLVQKSRKGGGCQNRVGRPLREDKTKLEGFDSHTRKAGMAVTVGLATWTWQNIQTTEGSRRATKQNSNHKQGTYKRLHSVVHKATAFRGPQTAHLATYHGIQHLVVSLSCFKMIRT